MRRSHPCLPSDRNVPPEYLSPQSRSGSAVSGLGPTLRGTSPTTSTRPVSSAPCNSKYPSPVSTATLTREPRLRLVQRWLFTIECSQSADPSQTNHNGDTWGAPSAPTLPRRQIFCDPRKSLSSSVVIAILRPRFCS